VSVAVYGRRAAPEELPWAMPHLGRGVAARANVAVWYEDVTITKPHSRACVGQPVALTTYHTAAPKVIRRHKIAWDIAWPVAAAMVSPSHASVSYATGHPPGVSRSRSRTRPVSDGHAPTA